ncbi:hypothetical protein DFLDMN_006354 (plasmid) [Cupriavidus sp. H19C3]
MLPARQLYRRGVLFVGHMVRKERVSITLTLLLAGESGLTAGVEIDGLVATKSGESHGGKGKWV